MAKRAFAILEDNAWAFSMGQLYRERENALQGSHAVYREPAYNTVGLQVAMAMLPCWGDFWTIFSVQCWLVKKKSYTLSRKKNINLIPEGFGSTWGYNFYMGTQNGGFLIRQIVD